jgi:Bacterial PH domain
MLPGVKPTSRPEVIRTPASFLLPLILLVWAIAAAGVPGWQWPAPLVRVPLVAVLLPLVGRAVWVGVVFDDKGVTLRNLFSTRRWPWVEVRGFERRGIVFIFVRAVLCLNSGGCHHVTALAPFGPPTPRTVRRFERYLGGLNEQIARRSASARLHSPSSA